MMEQIIQRYLAGEAILRLAHEFGIGYTTLRQRLVKIAPPVRAQGQNEPTSELERFWQKTIPEPNSGCWLWMGQHEKRYGYGVMFLRGRNQTAQRASWQIFCGPIPDAMQIDHKCRNPACVNPEHLRVVTKSENLAGRQMFKQRCRNGHLFTGDNLLLENGGKVRRCKLCRHQNRRKRR